MKAWAKASLAVFAVVSLLSATMAVAADDGAPSGRVTFTKDVLPILQENCQSCHRAGGANFAGMVAPMAFMSYSEVRPWAKSIVKRISTGEMPPWHASETFHGVFANERTITEEEIATIVKWVNTGAARGSAADAPEPIAWAETEDGWSLGKPDLIISMPEAYFIEDDVQDEYINFRTTITEEDLPHARWIKSIEYKPGSEAVHHVIARPLGGIAPGNDPTVYEEGYGKLLEPGTTVSFQMHYHKEAGPGTGMWDQSVIGVRFHPEDAHIKYVIGGGNVPNMRFEIPPGHPNWQVGGSHTFSEDTYLLAMMPHMHLRGKAAEYTAFYPDGTQETLLEVPQYDFNWQTTYKFKEAKFMPAGTRMEMKMWFDNSADNPSNPDYTKAIRFGGPTTDEMALAWYTSVNAKPREN